MRHITLVSVVLLVCLSMVVRGEAAIVYQFTDTAGIEQDSFVITGIGQTVDILVWLKQTDPDTVLTNEGLFSAGVKVVYSAAGVAEVLSDLDITPNPAFDDPLAILKEIGPDYVALDMAVSDPDLPVFPELATPDRIWLGTFRFTGLSLGAVQITAGDYAGVDNTLTGLGTLLDPQISSDQGSLGVVPEPSSLVILVGLALLATPFSWLRRRAL